MPYSNCLVISKTSLHFNTSLNREKPGVINDIGIMALELKGKVIEVVKEIVISTCGRGNT